MIFLGFLTAPGRIRTYGKHDKLLIYKGVNCLTDNLPTNLIKKFRLTITIICLFQLFSFPAHAYEFAKNWTWSDTALQVITVGVLVKDWKDTRHIAADPHNHSETCFLMSNHPSIAEVDRHFATAIIGHTLISLALPDKIDIYGYKIPARTIWQSVWIGIEAGYGAHNYYSCGIRWNF